MSDTKRDMPTSRPGPSGEVATRLFDVFGRYWPCTIHMVSAKGADVGEPLTVESLESFPVKVGPAPEMLYAIEMRKDGVVLFTHNIVIYPGDSARMPAPTFTVA